MSGPITPPLTVTTSGTGTPSGRPITTIKVSDGDLTISGNVATIDTSGSGGVPGGSTTEVQYNNAGAFAGDAGFSIVNAGGGSSTKIRVGDILIGGSPYALVQAVQDGSLLISPEGSGQLTLTSNNDAGGTITDMQVNITANSATDDPILKLGNLSSPSGEMRLDGATGDVLISALGTNNDLDLKINGTGQVEVINTTTNNDTTFSVKGNGTGDAIINLNNPAKSVQLMCDTNQKLKVQGGLNNFIFDASSATGGIQWPDGTTQTTAASGGASALTDLSDVMAEDGADYTGTLILGNVPASISLTADSNVAVGLTALESLTTGDRNTCIGNDSGDAVTSARDSTFVGYNSGSSLSTKNGSTAIGAYALTSGVGGKNTAIGQNALYDADGDRNIAIGWLAGNQGYGATTYQGVVLIGTNIQADSTSADHQCKIGADNGTSTVTWLSGDSSGSCYQGDNASTWSTTSDRRLKTNISDIDSMLERINQVGIKTFNYKEKAEPIIETDEDEDGEIRERIVGYDGENRYNLDPEPLRIGVIAQELQEVFPDAVKENAFGHLTVNPDSINWALIKAVQELSAKVEALEAMIE